MARGATVTDINKNRDFGEFDERKVTIRGTEFTIRELSAEEYDTVLKQATKEDSDIDMVLLLKLMTLKSVKDPVLNAENLAKLPYKVSRRLSTAVNELHFGDDDDEQD